MDATKLLQSVVDAHKNGVVKRLRITDGVYIVPQLNYHGRMAELAYRGWRMRKNFGRKHCGIYDFIVEVDDLKIWNAPRNEKFSMESKNFYECLLHNLIAENLLDEARQIYNGINPSKLSLGRDKDQLCNILQAAFLQLDLNHGSMEFQSWTHFGNPEVFDELLENAVPRDLLMFAINYQAKEKDPSAARAADKYISPTQSTAGPLISGGLVAKKYRPFFPKSKNEPGLWMWIATVPISSNFYEPSKPNPYRIQPYERAIHSNEGVEVVFANIGGKFHNNPNPINFKGISIKCRNILCDTCTQNENGICDDCGESKTKLLHSADWVTFLRFAETTDNLPKAKDSEKKLPRLKLFAVAHADITEYLVRWMGSDASKILLMDNLIHGALKCIVGRVPDATSLQESISPEENECSKMVKQDDLVKYIEEHRESEVRNEDYLNTPDEVVSMMTNLIENTVKESKKKFETVKVRLLPGDYPAGIIKLPIGSLAALLIAAFTCEEANRGDYWFCNKHKQGVPVMASAYMPATYYLLRRYAKCPEPQARAVIGATRRRSMD